MVLSHVRKRSRSRHGRWSWLALLLCLATAVPAAELGAPEAQVILRVDGNIGVTNTANAAHFDRRLLESLGMQRIRTTTAWTEGVVEFEGVPVRSLLQAVGAGGRDFRAVALNDYAADVEGLDFDKYPALLALKMNGEYMSVREKGPIWLVLPQSDFPELDTPSWRFVWVWQLNAITVH